VLSARARLWRLSVLYRLFSLDEWRIKCIEEEEYDRAWRVLSTVLYMFYWTFFFHPGFVYGQGNRLSRVISKRRRIRTLARTISTGFRDETYCVVLLMDFLSKKKQKTYSTRLLSTMKSDINFQLGKWLSDWRNSITDHDTNQCLTSIGLIFWKLSANIAQLYLNEMLGKKFSLLIII